MLVTPQEQLFRFLDEQKIEYRCFEHEPVFRVGEPLQHHGKDIEISGAHTKNLFLQDQKSKRFFLVSVAEEIRVDLKQLAKDLGVNKFSFGKAEDLFRLLAVEPGSVTPFGLLFDQVHEVDFVVDQNLMRAVSVCFHPLKNDKTLQLTPQAFEAFIVSLGRKIQAIDIPAL